MNENVYLKKKSINNWHERNKKVQLVHKVVKGEGVVGAVRCVYACTASVSCSKKLKQARVKVQFYC